MPDISLFIQQILFLGLEFFPRRLSQSFCCLLWGRHDSFDSLMPYWSGRQWLSLLLGCYDVGLLEPLGLDILDVDIKFLDGLLHLLLSLLFEALVNVLVPFPDIFRVQSQIPYVFLVEFEGLFVLDVGW